VYNLFFFQHIETLPPSPKKTFWKHILLNYWLINMIFVALEAWRCVWRFNLLEATKCSVIDIVTLIPTSYESYSNLQYQLYISLKKAKKEHWALLPRPGSYEIEEKKIHKCTKPYSPLLLITWGASQVLFFFLQQANLIGPPLKKKNKKQKLWRLPQNRSFYFEV